MDVLETLKNNQPLTEFCKKICSYKIALESDKKYLFLASLISADSLMDEQSCLNSLNKINFILDNIKLFDLENESEILKFLKKGIKIIKKDLNKFRK